MTLHRQGEHGAIPFRTGRFFNIDSNWYFACREGLDKGPYSSREEAHAALVLYIRDMNTLNTRLYESH